MLIEMLQEVSELLTVLWIMKNFMMQGFSTCPTVLERVDMLYLSPRTGY
jgi:hypothetical protein